MATSNTVEIKVDASVTGQPQIEQLKGSLESMAPAAQKTGQAGASAGKGLVDMGAGAAKADDNLSATRRGLISISKQLDETQKGIASLRDSLITGWSFQQFVQAAAQMEQVQAGLTAVAGSSEQAGQQMDFVRTVAMRTGVDVVEAGRAFLGLSAATKGTAVEGEPTRQVFEAVASAMAKAGKSSAETQNALTALSQIASKGVVSMEELRGQLGEALPGALQAVASGLGITTQDLNKLVESGQVAAQDLFPALVSGLNGIYGTAPAAQTLSQEITNIKNSFVEMSANIGNAGGLDALKVGAELAQTAIVYLDDTLITVGKTIGVVTAAIVSMDFSGLKQAFADIEAESRTKLLKAAEHNTVLAASIRAAGTDATQTALSVSEHAKATTAAGAAASTAAPKYIALANAYTKVREDLTGQIEQAEKSVAARDKEAAAMVALARLYGTEAEVRQASAKAAALQADAAQKLADVRATEVAVMRAELAAKTAQLEADGKISDQRKKELKELADLIDKRQADADKARAQAAAAKVLVEQTALEIEVHKDNSARLSELKDAYEAARIKLSDLQKQKAAGKATDDQVAEADKAAAKAATLYRDALGDVVTKLQARQITEKANASVIETTLNAQKSYYKAVEDSARATGDYDTALRANIEQKKIDIALINARVQAMRAEAEGAIAIAKAELAVLDASGKVDPVKRAQIEASIKVAEAKKMEATALGLSTKSLEDEINALQSGTKTLDGFNNATKAAAGYQDVFQRAAAAATAALEAQNAVRERAISAKEKENELTQRAIDLENKRLNVDREGYSINPKTGERVVMTAQTDRTVYENAKSQGLSDAQALQIVNQFMQNGAQVGGGATADGGNWYTALQKAIDKVVLQNAAKTASTEAADNKTTATQSSSTTQNHTYTVNIPNYGTVNVASASDASSLTSILEQLARAKASAG